jgi:hypothetical protein
MRVSHRRFRSMSTQLIAEERIAPLHFQRGAIIIALSNPLRRLREKCRPIIG